MPRSDYAVGLLFFVPTAGSALVVATLITLRRCAGLTGSSLAMAFGVIALGSLVGVHMMLGALGALSRESVLIVSLLLVAALWRLVPAADEPLLPPPRPEPSGLLSWAIAVATVAVVSVWAAGWLLQNVAMPPMAVDVYTFHLPNLARWIQIGSFWQIDEFVPDQAFGYYPNNGDIVALAAILPWENDFLMRLVNMPLFAMSGVGTYALGRELGAPRATATALAACVVAVPAAAFVAFEGMPDPFMFATFTAGVLFLLRHARTHARTDLVLTGLALGLSLGSKWYAFPAVASVLAVWATTSFVAHRRTRPLLLQSLVLAGFLAAGAAVWLVRNAIESGNPLFPSKVDFLGVALLDAPATPNLDIYGRSIASYGFDVPIWKEYIGPGLYGSLGLTAVLVAAGAGASAVMAARARSPAGARRPDGRTLAMAACALLIAVIYVFLPYTAQGDPGRPYNVGAAARYAVPAMLLGAAVTAWAASRLGRLRVVIEGAALVAAVNAVGLNPAPSDRRLLMGAVAVAFSAAVAGYLLRHPPPLRLAVPVGVACLVGGFAAGGLLLQERFNDGRYRGVNNTVDYVQENGSPGQRIGLAGPGFPGVPVVYPMFGDRLANHVEYIGPFVEGMLRPHTRRETFLQAVGKGGYDFVVVQLGSPLTRPDLARRHDRWMGESGYRLVAEDPEVRLYAR